MWHNRGLMVEDYIANDMDCPSIAKKWGVTIKEVVSYIEMYYGRKMCQSGEMALKKSRDENNVYRMAEKVETLKEWDYKMKKLFVQVKVSNRKETMSEIAKNIGVSRSYMYELLE